MELIVRSIDSLTDNIKAFTLAAADGQPLPPFAAGAHIKVDIPDLDEPIPSRSYSLFNGAEDGVYRIAVLLEREGRGGSRHMHEKVAVGDRLKCGAPGNDFPLASGAGKSLLIAGGIGITPILSMARELVGKDADFTLHYSAKGRADMALREEVLDVADGRTTLYFDGGDPARGIPLAHLLARPDAGTHVYVCGPSGLIDAVVATAKERGWPTSNIHFERFTAPAAGEDDATFEVELAQSGQTLTVPADKSILDVLIDADLDPLYDCHAGNCGLCVQKVLDADGEIEHRDAFLSDAQKSAKDQMCVCVSRIKGTKVTLDL